MNKALPPHVVPHCLLAIKKRSDIREISHEHRPFVGGTFVEIGTYRGSFMRSVFATSTFKEWIGIDPHEPLEEWRNDPLNDEERLDNARTDALHAYRQHNRPPEKITNLMEMTEEEACPQFDDDSIEAVYLDADHGYLATWNAIERWWPKVKPGGVLWGHDYCYGHPENGGRWGVVQAVNEFAARLVNAPLITTAEPRGPSWMIYKPTQHDINQAR